MTGYAKVIAHSVTEDGDQLFTVEGKFHRNVLAEFNTHGVLAPNSASARAIPVEKMMDRFRDDPAWPLEWASEQKGMQGGDELTGDNLYDAMSLLGNIHDSTFRHLHAYLAKHPEKSMRLHKSLLNRTMEWAQWHTVCVTGTAWDNFFRLRLDKAAQPEIRVFAEQVKEAMDASKPTLLREGQWHLPYIQPDELASIGTGGLTPTTVDGDVWARVSAARVARVSYLTQDGKRDVQADIDLYNRLVEFRHSSPLEQVATPEPANKHSVNIARRGDKPFYVVLPVYGKLLGWRQLRYDVEAEQRYQSFS